MLTDFLAQKDNEVLELILREGPLARRMLKAYHDHGMEPLFKKLANCLAQGGLFK